MAGISDYSAYVISGTTKYDISDLLISIDRSEREGEIAQRVNVTLADDEVGSKWLSTTIKVRSRIFIHDDGTEVFRGFVWGIGSKHSLTDREFTLKCYDNLIYLQESQESLYFPAGKSTKDVMSTICSNWGISLNYSYNSITHSKLALRGTLSDIILDDILDIVKDRTGAKYVVLSDKDAMVVRPIGQNSTIYHIEDSENAISTKSECSMDGMTTQVKILGKADENDCEPVEATISGDTANYGTLQKIISRSENTALADAKKEAQSIVDKDGKPKWEYSVDAPDVPGIRKGDRVKVDAGGVPSGTYYVTCIDRSISNTGATMSLTLEP